MLKYIKENKKQFKFYVFCDKCKKRETLWIFKDIHRIIHKCKRCGEEKSYQIRDLFNKKLF